MNRTLQEMLSKRVTAEQNDWDKYVRATCWAYNTSVHSATGYSPFEMLYGTKARMPLDAQVLPSLRGRTATEWYTNVVRRKEIVLRNGLQNQRDSARQQRAQHDKGLKAREFQVGDIVRWYRPQVALGKSQKLARLWKGPYQIVERKSAVLYKIMDEEGKCPQTPAHAMDLVKVAEKFKGEEKKEQEERNEEQEEKGTSKVDTENPSEHGNAEGNNQDVAQN